MSKHLPGPWEARKTPPDLQSPDKIGDGIEYDVITDYDDSAQLFVADCGCQPESEANARLIAAAPDMLSLLQELVTCGYGIHGCGINAKICCLARAKDLLARLKSWTNPTEIT